MVVHVRCPCPPALPGGMPESSQNQMGHIIPTASPVVCAWHLPMRRSSDSAPTSFWMSGLLSLSLRKLISASCIHDVELDLHLTKEVNSSRDINTYGVSFEQISAIDIITAATLDWCIMCVKAVSRFKYIPLSACVCILSFTRDVERATQALIETVIYCDSQQ